MTRVLIGLFLVSGCRQWQPYAGAFDIPGALGVAHPADGAPFEEPVGFVANKHGGQVVMLALKQGRFLTDDATVAYLRGNQLAYGQRRLLEGVLPHTRDDGTMSVFALDAFYEQIVEVPWIVGFDPTTGPIEPETTVTDPVGSSAASISPVSIKTGWTTSESWTVTYDGLDGGGWDVVGSRSGSMPTQAFADEEFVGRDRAVAFTISGVGAPGDSFTFETDNGAIEHDAGGRPLELKATADNSFAAVIVHGDQDVVKLFDPERPQDFAAGQPVDLGSARPARMAWSPSGDRLFVTDSANPIVWELQWSDIADRSAYTITPHSVPWPTLDVAPMLGDEELLYLVPLDDHAYFVLDLGTGRLRDLNPWMAGVQGMVMDGPITGLESIPLPYLQLERTNDGIRRTARSVAVSLASGAVVFAQEHTGCLVDDGDGPRTRLQGQAGTDRDYVRDFVNETVTPPYMENATNNGRHVLGNPCSGITREQNWVLTYDELVQGWRVQGLLSGVQRGVAYEDQRYVSDDGEVTFLIRSGGVPSRDGWEISFRMIAGVTASQGNVDLNGTTRDVIIDRPGDPLFFHYTVGGDDNGWKPVDDRAYVLVAGESSDRVARVMPNEGRIDASWD